jgi:hypothetical protein
MSWFDVGRALLDINSFLRNWSALLGNLDQNVRPSYLFECYCFVTVVQSYRDSGYRIAIRGPSLCFFKTTTRGFPNNYTHFVVSRDQE